MNVLFESLTYPAGVEGRLIPVQSKPVVRETPVLIGDNAVDGLGAVIYGTVLRDGGIYRMWYQAFPKAWGGGDVSYVGYAESDDGDEWRKPELGLVESGGDAKNNLTDLGFHAPSVFIDPTAPATHRYRGVGCAMRHREGSFQQIVGSGYYLAHSSDGLHWELSDTWPAWEGVDVITSVYHPARACAQVALKRLARYRGIPRRAIWEGAVVDGEPQPCRRALVPDDFDDVAAAARGFASGDYYGMGMQPAGQGTVGFLWNFRHWLPRAQDAGVATELGRLGGTRISLVYQESPGAAWQHVAGRPDFIAYNGWPNAQSSLRRSACSASCPVEVGDEHRLYVTLSTDSHGSRRKEKEPSSITYASWPKWRLFGFRSDPEGILSLHLGKLSEPVELRLNYECEPGGSIRAEVVNDRGQPLEMDISPGLAGCTLDASVPLEGSSLSAPIVWRERDVIDAFEGEVVVRLHMDRATAWAYEAVNGS